MVVARQRTCLSNTVWLQILSADKASATEWKAGDQFLFSSGALQSSADSRVPARV